MKPSIISSLKGYNKETFTKDLLSGIIVGIVALPLAIAFGIASGVTPEQGIITAIVAGLIISLLGGSKVQIGGPTGAFIVIIAGIIGQYGTAGLAVATVLAGALLILLGAFRLGTIIKYIPYPIVVGFTSGIALTIFTTQVKDLLGLTVEGSIPADFVSKWVCYAENISSIDPWSTAVGLGSVALIACWPMLNRIKYVGGKASALNKIPGSLVAIIVMTVGILILKSYGLAEHVDTIGDRFRINASLPSPEVPALSWEVIRQLFAPALTIAVLGAIESLLSATVADGVIGDRHDSNQELIAQGVANLLCPLFGGIPATGAIARTMTNINNGGHTPIAGIIHAVVLLLIFLLLMPYAQYIPMACLAGVLVIVAYNMSGWRTFRQLLKNPKSDISVLLITFLLTVIFDLTVAIEVGLMLACLLCMRRMAETTQVSVLTDEIDPATEVDFEATNLEHFKIPDGCEVYEINGPFFFGIANRFEEIMGRMGRRPKVRIIRMRKVPFVDSTGMHNLENLIQMSRQDGIHVILSGVTPKVHEVLMRNGFGQLLGEDNIQPHINLALQRAKEVLGK
ncbi:MAG: STAS domain-containing protein [Bacteroidaceae bacterium]|nr:STAS domain-containing protein [Bacteroidaceae bacterium]